MKTDQNFFLFFLFPACKREGKVEKEKKYIHECEIEKKKEVSDPRECEFQPITTAPFHFIGAGVPWVWSIFFLLQEIFSG